MPAPRVNDPFLDELEKIAARAGLKAYDVNPAKLRLTGSQIVDGEIRSPSPEAYAKGVTPVSGRKAKRLLKERMQIARRAGRDPFQEAKKAVNPRRLAPDSFAKMRDLGGEEAASKARARWAKETGPTAAAKKYVEGRRRAVEIAKARRQAKPAAVPAPTASTAKPKPPRRAGRGRVAALAGLGLLAAGAARAGLGKRKEAAEGHWRKLPSGDSGHDQTGNPIQGKTWVRRGRMKPGFKPKPHQLKYRRAAIKEPGTIAFHGTGTGKTFSAIDSFEKMKDRGIANRALVVTPAGLRDNFLNKGVRTFTDSKGVILSKPKEVDDSVEYVVASYAAFRRDPEGWLKKVNPDVVIADEVHKAGNPRSKNFQTLMFARQNVRRFMGLTASGAQNAPEDILPLLQLAQGGKSDIRDQKQFRKKFVKSVPSRRRGIFGGKQRDQELVNLDQLKKAVGGSIHFVEDLDATEKPSKEVQTVETPMSKEQEQLYRMSMKGLDPVLVSKIQSGEKIPDAKLSNVFMRLMRARQVSNSLSTATDMSPSEAAKQTPKMKKILDDAEEHIKSTPDAQIVMYSNFYKGGVDTLVAGLRDRGIPFGVFAGRGQPGVTDETRQQAVDDYLAGRIKVILITSAGAEGLSLGNTTMVQMADGHYNPERIAQAEARGIRAGGLAHRDPKERKVLVNRYVSTLPRGFWAKLLRKPKERSVGEYVYAVADRKDRLNAQLRQALEEGSKKHERKRQSPFYGMFKRSS